MREIPQWWILGRCAPPSQSSAARRIFSIGLGQWACQEAAGREKLVKTPAPAQEVGVSRRRPLARAPCLRGSEFFFVDWDDAAEGIGEESEGPEGFRDSDDDEEGRGVGDGGATRRRGEIANGPSGEGDGGARGNNGGATEDANRGTGDGGDGDGEGDSDVDITRG